MPLVTGSSDKVGKRKRKESLEPANSQDETEVLLDAPQPKKAKTQTGMASIPIGGPSQLVCQLIDNAHLSISATTNYFLALNPTEKCDT